MNSSDSEIKESNCDFGSVLAEARQFQNYTIEEISMHLKIPVHMISAIEASDIGELPAATFAKGYLRAYARFLEISEENVLELYNRAVPHERAEKLKSRSNLSNETNSQSPLIKAVTAFLIVAGFAAVIYGGFQYYQEKASVMENELESKERSFTGNSPDSPGLNSVNIEQKAPLTDADELVLQQPGSPEKMAEEDKLLKGTEISEPEVPGSAKKLVVEPGPEVEGSQQMANNEHRQDGIEFIAEKGSWMEVRDANQTRLFYGMVPEGGSKVLHGQAPFRVSLGNAKTTRVVINDLEVDMSDYIRANNTAKFKVSSEEQNVIFH